MVVLGVGSRGEFVLVSTSFTGRSTNLLKKTEKGMVINEGSRLRGRCTISHFNLPVFLFYFIRLLYLFKDYYTSCLGNLWEHFWEV